METSSSLYVTTLPGLVAIGIEVAEMFVIYHVTSRNYVFKRLHNFME